MRMHYSVNECGVVSAAMALPEAKPIDIYIII